IAKPANAAVTKWRRRAIEAAKQSGRAWVPDVETPQSLQNVIERSGAFDRFCFSDIWPSAAPLAQIVSAIPTQGSLLVAVGPEGGWSNEEREQAKHASADVVSLAATQLRTETAAVAVCACVAMPAQH
ncbi:MAG: RNA methyltransferase, partial [Chloroflexi bacterium]|nr:RNA methyltransferase [Chloroflexota bacterium]